MSDASTLKFASAPARMLLCHSTQGESHARVEHRPQPVNTGERIGYCVQAPLPQKRLLRRSV